MIKPAMLVLTGCVLAAGAARADYVPPFKGNDTGGIISYHLVRKADVRPLIAAHCAQYHKVGRILATQAYYGGYISFACKWVPYGALDRPLRTKY